MARSLRSVPDGEEFMFQWFLITYNYQAFQQVNDSIRALLVEAFSPVTYSLKKRSDGTGHRSKSTHLFPGYLFVRLNPEDVHPSTISVLPGVKEFVRFGGEICAVSDLMIDSLKQSIVLRSNRKITQIEYANASVDLVKSLEDISHLGSVVARQSAYLRLIQEDAEIYIKKKSRFTTIATVLEIPVVNDLIK